MMSHAQHRRTTSSPVGGEIPNLGKAATDSASSSESFLVAGREVQVNARPISVLGDRQYAIDQLLNPHTISFTPGGIWNGGYCFEWCVATVSDSAPAQEMMKRFHSAFKKRFTKVKAFLVGPEAVALLNAGKRLTAAAQCPPEYDLRIT